MYRCTTPKAKELYDSNPQKHIELIGRVCYKSEDKIADGTDKKFISNMYNNNHWAMLEHFRFIMEVPANFYEHIVNINSPYIRCTKELCEAGYYRYMISASARGLLDALDGVNMWRTGIDGDKNATVVALLAIIKHIVWYYNCDELFGGDFMPCKQYNIFIIEMDVLDCSETYTAREKMAHGWHSVKFTCDRGVTHELVRHRPASFAQESTRYCNYSLGKFDEAICVIRPFEFKDGELLGLWEKCMHYANEMYNQLIHAGASPQWARSILPQSTKADIVVTCNMEEWQHIINLRYRGTTGKLHPQMVEVMSSLVENCDWAKELAGVK